jgi:hypothetical protein
LFAIFVSRKMLIKIYFLGGRAGERDLRAD